ncbi:unnamed protein product [marine sediment metagenome]|uniref:Uncharacterized protein n=1 Tax=marine sediment metagenome TaxID=412755 RepID=X1KNT6_9ZZZZ
MDLDGKIAIVTGASGGIGSATALALTGKNATVVLNYYKNEIMVNQTAEKIVREGHNCLIIQGDVSHFDKAEKCNYIPSSAIRFQG